MMKKIRLIPSVMAVLLVPCYAQNPGNSGQQHKDSDQQHRDCDQQNKDEVCFDARTTGSLGQIHVRKEKKLIIHHLNRVKNDYQLQRNITVLAPQTDLLTGLSWIPSLPAANPPPAAQAPTGGGTPAPATPDAAKGKTPDTQLPTMANLLPGFKPGPITKKAGREAAPARTPTYTPDDAKHFLTLFAETAANKMLVNIANESGFSAAELQTIKKDMLNGANEVISAEDLKQVATAMQDPKNLTIYEGHIRDALTTGYTSSAPYLQHTYFKALSDGLLGLSVRLANLQQDLFDLKNAVADADRKLADALASAQSFAVNSDGLDKSNLRELLKQQIDALEKVKVSPAEWFSKRAKVNANILSLSTDLAALAAKPGYNDWKTTDGVKDQLTAFSSTLAADTTYINSLDPDSSDRVTARAKANAVQAHFVRVSKLDDIELTQIQDHFVCNDDTQKATYTLVVNDLTDNKTAATVEVVTFTCYAPLSLSGGIGFNSLPERTYQLVTPVGTVPAGTTAPPSTIQYDKNSSFQIAPLLLLNVRIRNYGDCCALHASFGAGVSIPASGSGTTSGTGTQLTYLGGPSVSLRDKVYFTVGPFFGRTNTLANGYSIGSSLPSGVTTIPLETKFSVGIGVAVTYKLK